MSNFSEFIIIPFWVENLLKRNRMPLRDILDYQKIRRVASPEDLAGVMALQGVTFKVLGDQDFYGNTLLSSWRDTAHQSHSTELDSVIIHLSNSERVIEDVSSRLSLGKLEQANPDQLPFRLVDFEKKKIGVMVSESFLTEISGGDVRFSLVKSMVKAMQIYNAIHEVASSNLYRSYLELLQKRLPLNAQAT